MFLIETPGSRSTSGAIVERAEMSPPPGAARVVGTVTFKDSMPYESLNDWEADRCAHRIQKGSQHDWRGPSIGEMHGWTVEKTRRLAEPIHVGSDKQQTGWGSARTLEVRLEADSAPMDHSLS